MKDNLLEPLALRGSQDPGEIRFDEVVQFLDSIVAGSRLGNQVAQFPGFLIGSSRELRRSD